MELRSAISRGVKSVFTARQTFAPSTMFSLLDKLKSESKYVILF